MKMRLPIFVLSVLFSMVSVAQEIMERDDIFIKNLNSLYQNPEQTVKVGNYHLENSNANSEKAKGFYLLSKSKMLIGKSAEGIEDLFKAKEILRDEESPFIASLVLTSLSEQCRKYGMDDIASTYLSGAENFLKKIASIEEKKIAQVIFFQEQATSLIQKNHSDQAIQKLKESIQISNANAPAFEAISQNALGNYYLSASHIDSSEAVFKKTISILNSYSLGNSSIESVSLLGLGNVELNKNEFGNAINYYKKALGISVVESPTRIKILGNLSEVYKRLDSISASQKFYTEKVLLDAKTLDAERQVRSVIVSHIDAEQKGNLLHDKKAYYKWGAWFAALFILVFVGYYFYNRKLNREYKRFQKLLAQVDKDEKLEAPYSIDDSSLKPSKGIVIPEETEKNILERLEEFENTTKFTNSTMNLALLAKQMKTNSKYISEIIHTHKQKNFNTYINELRVNYIIHLMKTDKAYLNYKVSYLAETCGFSSHSAFTVVFKSITGFTPKQFIVFLKKSKKEKSASF